MVLGEPFRRRADGADDPGAQVRFAADPIVQLLPHRIVEQAVDGEVAPAGVGLRVAERDPFRVPAILVIRLGPEGGHLELVAAFDHHHHPELAPDGNRAFEEVLDLFRQGGGDDVVIARLAAQQEIAHAAADPEGREPGALAAGGRCRARRFRRDLAGGALMSGRSLRLPRLAGLLLSPNPS